MALAVAQQPHILTRRPAQLCFVLLCATMHTLCLVGELSCRSTVVDVGAKQATHKTHLLPSVTFRCCCFLLWAHAHCFWLLLLQTKLAHRYWSGSSITCIITIGGHRIPTRNVNSKLKYLDAFFFGVSEYPKKPSLLFPF